MMSRGHRQSGVSAQRPLVARPSSPSSPRQSGVRRRVSFGPRCEGAHLAPGFSRRDAEPQRGRCSSTPLRLRGLARDKDQAERHRERAPRARKWGELSVLTRESCVSGAFVHESGGSSPCSPENRASRGRSCTKVGGALRAYPRIVRLGGVRARKWGELSVPTRESYVSRAPPFGEALDASVRTPCAGLLTRRNQNASWSWVRNMFWLGVSLSPSHSWKKSAWIFQGWPAM